MLKAGKRVEILGSDDATNVYLSRMTNAMGYPIRELVPRILERVSYVSYSVLECRFARATGMPAYIFSRNFPQSHRKISSEPGSQLVEK
jgi:hypothetical protein